MLMTNFWIRKLEKDDLHLEYFQVLSGLTEAPVPNEQRLQERFCFLNQRQDTYTVLVVLDGERVIGSGTLLVEHKFIRDLGKVGHIEDVGILEEYQGEGLGKKLVGELVEHAKKQGCYKTILACSDKNEPFYESCGFQRKEIEMAMYHVEK